MNIQTERLENHTARLTVEIEPERLEKAKRAAAKSIAKQVNIPGFRKGKAPYRILLQYGFEANILNDAVDKLSQEVYGETIQQSEDLQPYGPGAWEDFKLEETPTFIYTVPLQPEVTLGDYRAVRVDFEEPEIDDELVDNAIRRLQQQEALVEESSAPIALGNRVTLDIHSEFADDPPEDTVEEEEDEDASEEEPAEADEDNADDEADVEDDNSDETPPPPEKGTPFIHEHDAQVNLDPEDEPIMKGFNEALVGANVDEDVEFELTIPEDDENYDDIRGRKIHFQITVKKVEVVTLPELNDDFAARVTEDEEEPLTLLALRMRMRENLVKEAEQRVKSQYVDDMLTEFVDISEISYPEAMVQDQIDSMLEDLDGRMRQQGMSLESYMQVMNVSREDIAADYHEPAENTVKRSLILGEIVKAEQLKVKDAEINARIDEILSQFGEQAEGLRSAFDTPAMRENIVNDLVQSKILERIVAIGRGEELPEPGADDEDDEETTDDEVTAEADESAEVVDSVEGEPAEDDTASTDEDEDEPAEDTVAEDDPATDETTDSEETPKE